MIIVSSYSETNFDTVFNLGSGDGVTGFSQSFTGIDAKLEQATFYLSSFGFPTGNMVAKLYDITGTYGNDSHPTGSPLAVSDVVDASVVTGTIALIDFPFSGVNQLTLVNGQHYAIAIEYSGGNGSNFVQVGADVSTPSGAPGNVGALVSGSWVGANTSALIFYVYAFSDISVDLTGVAATPVIGDGTFETFPIPPIPSFELFGGGKGRRLHEREVEPIAERDSLQLPSLPPLPPKTYLRTKKGAAARPKIGKFSFNNDFVLPTIPSDHKTPQIRSMFDVQVSFSGVPIARSSLGKLGANITVDLLPEEISALIDAM